jgi:hypothetical protein
VRGWSRSRDGRRANAPHARSTERVKNVSELRNEAPVRWRWRDAERQPRPPHAPRSHRLMPIPLCFRARVTKICVPASALSARSSSRIFPLPFPFPLPSPFPLPPPTFAFPAPAPLKTYARTSAFGQHPLRIHLPSRPHLSHPAPHSAAGLRVARIASGHRSARTRSSVRGATPRRA